MSNSIPIIITVSDKDAISKLGNVKRAIDDLKASAGKSSAGIGTQFNAAFTQVNASATKVQATYTQVFNNITNVTNRTTNNMRQAFNQANKDMKTSAKTSLGRILQYMENLRNKMSASFKEFNKQDTAPRFFTSLTGSASIVGSVVTALGNAAAAAHKLSGEFYSAENSLKAITGSGAAAKESMGFISSEANRLGQDVTTLAKSYTQLVAAGNRSNLTTKQMRDVFSSLSETATVLQFDAQKTEGSFRALTQMLSKGKVQAEELRGQLGEHLPGAFGIAADAMGVTEAALDSMLKKGQVSAAELLTKLPAALRKAYGEGLPGALQRSSVAIARMQNEAKAFGAGIGDSLEPAYAGLAKLGEAIIHVFNTDSSMMSVKEMSTSFGTFLSNVANGLNDFSGHTVKTFFDIADGFASMTTVIELTWQGLCASLGILFGVGIDAIGLQIATVVALWDGGINTIKELWAGMLGFMAQGASSIGQDNLAKSLNDQAASIKGNIVPAMDTYIKRLNDIANNSATGKMIADSKTKTAAILADYDAERNVRQQALALYEQEHYGIKKSIDLNAELSDANRLKGTKTQDQIDAEIEAQKTLDELKKEGIKLTEQMRTPAEEYNATLAELNNMLTAGAINQETFNRASAKAAEDYKQASEKMSKAAKETAKSIEDTNKAWAQLKEKNQTPYEEYQAGLKEIVDLQDKSNQLGGTGAGILIDQQSAMRERLRLQDEYQQKLVEMNLAFDWKGLMQKGLEGTSQILTDYLVDPFNTSTDQIKEKFSSMLKSMAGELLKNAAMQTFTRMFNINGEAGKGAPGLFGGMNKASGPQGPEAGGGLGSILGSLFGGGGGGQAPIAAAMGKGACNTDCATQTGDIIKSSMLTGATTTGTQIQTSMQTSGTGFMSMFTDTGTSLWSSLSSTFSSAQGGFSSIFSNMTSSLGGLFSSLPQILGGLFGGGGGGGGAAGAGAGQMIGSAMGASGNPYMALAGMAISAFAANGKVMEGGSLQAFADGGIVNGPTKFPMASGNMGLMGEAGPEAIMPLTRGPDGKLAVSAHGGGGAEGITIINLLDAKLLDAYLSSDKAGKVIMNHLSKNSGTVKGIARG